MRNILNSVFTAVVMFALLGCSTKNFDAFMDNKLPDEEVFSIVQMSKKEAMNRLKKISAVKMSDYQLEEQTEDRLLYAVKSSKIEEASQNSNDAAFWIAKKNGWSFMLEHLFLTLKDNKTKIITRSYVQNKEGNRGYYDIKNKKKSMYVIYSNLDMVLDGYNPTNPNDKSLKKILGK